jgi:HD-GYP domain-containing protein (c-di-GMP phosphodiesterase class II)
VNEKQRTAAWDRKAMLNQIVTGLVKAIRNMGFYASDHPTVTAALSETAEALDAYLSGGAEELHLKLVEGEVVADDRPVREASAAIANLAGACRRRGIESLRLVRGVRPTELAELVNVLSMDPQALAQAGGASRILARQEVSHLLVERLTEVDEEMAAGATSMPTAPGETYQNALDVMRGIVRQARLRSPINVDGANRMVQDLVDLIVREQSEMLGVISVKHYDEYTFTHGLHICILSIAMGCAISLGHELLADLGVSALLHDVGKINIPLEVLRKPGALTEEEFALVRRHPVDGALILAAQRAMPDVAPLVAFEHHLRPDLRGYPPLKRPRELNLFSLIVGVADVYDALTTERPYRPPLPPHEALALMHSGKAGAFEPRLLGRLTEMLGRYPPGTLLRLSDGSMAIVSRPNPRDAVRPFVRRVIEDDADQTLDREEINLAAAESRVSLDDVLDPSAAGVDVARLLRESPQPQTARQAASSAAHDH